MNHPPVLDVEIAAAARASRRSSGPCPAEERWIALVRGECGPDEADLLRAHLEDCPECVAVARDGLRFLEAFGERSAAGARAPIRSLVRWRWLAVAAVLVIAVAVPTLLHRRPSSPPVLRGAEAFEIESRLADGAALPRDGFILRWSPGPEGTRYGVRVADEELVVLYDRRAVESNELEVPESVLAGLASDSEVLWQVEAALPGGDRITSQTFRNRVR